jgi:galactose mutarotase-like enzyme
VYAPRDESKAETPQLPWVCVEPVTMVNNALNSTAEHTATGTRVLEPGETLRTMMRLTFARD